MLDEHAFLLDPLEAGVSNHARTKTDGLQGAAARFERLLGRIDAN
jgi:hypothetical protein